MLDFRSLSQAWVFILLADLPCLTAADPAEKIATVEFKTDVRPILSNRCFACHGPDEKKVESGLKLDRFETATAPSDSGAIAIVPGNLERSELLRRIKSQDDAERMPPATFGAKLSDREIKAIEAWIASGAKYSKHWSFDEITPIVPGIGQTSRADRIDEPNAAWSASPIDFFVKKKLDERGWKPAPTAPQETLFRRLSLDLVGLPPSLELQRAIASGNNSQKYEQLVDELLASPAFGEHWGRKWLDLARYADSAGYADDPQRTIWGYRDWVIRAINQGMPFDQFTIEQLAGDLLPNPTDDQLVATAFHRNTLTNNEGGTNDEEFRNVALVDRVNTTMAVWMGLTMACAQCHNHKFDPISQKEYFQVMAIFNQTEDADRTDESPVLKWFSPDQRKLRQETQLELNRVESELVANDPSLIGEQEEWSKPFRTPLSWMTAKPESAKARSKSPFKFHEDGRVTVDTISDSDVYTIEIPLADNPDAKNLRGIQITSLPDPSLPNGGAAIGDGNFVLTSLAASIVEGQSLPVEGRYVRIDLPGDNKILSLAEVQVFSDGANAARAGKATQSSTEFDGPPELAIDGKTTGKYTDKSTTHTASSASPWWELDLGKAIAIEKIDVWNRTDGLVSDRLAGAKVQVLSHDRKVLWESSIDTPKASQSFEIRRSVSIPLLAANADFEQEGFPAANVIDNDTKSGWAVGGAVQRSHQLLASVDKQKWRKQFESNPISGKAMIRLSLKFESTVRRAVLASFSIQLTSDERTDSVSQLPSNIAQFLSKDLSSISDVERNAIHSYYVSAVAPSREALRAKRVELTKKLSEIKPTTTVPIFKELPASKRRTTHIQIRGNYKVQGDVVEPNIPVAFHAWKPSNLGSGADDRRPIMDRLQFSQWLMQSDNPLTARVIVNRYWENFFGVGIVRTSEEFGSQGDLPSNPELLDFLAQQLIRDGWDTKRLIKRIVMSDAYRQQSSVTHQRYEEDPENVFVSRGPRFRVSAEQVRDMALDAAGLLSGRMFGPPAQPPQPSQGLKAAFGSKTDWDTSKGEDRFRRGIYTLWRRSNPYPSMATFDAPNREVCVLKRDRTNTPLQALVTLNDPAFVEAAQGLARRVVIYELPNAESEERIERLFRHTLSRSPNPAEVKSLLKLYRETYEALASDVGQAEKLATEPLGKLPANAAPVELAAWTTVCNVLLNLDEFLMTP
ncbi:MAG: DUF1553 domain-containing protein [Pirellula sp.]